MSAPGKPYEPDDPTELVGVRLPHDLDDAAVREMATTIVEEFALMGWGRERVLRLFSNPRFAVPHRAYLALGEKRIRELIAGVFPGAEDADA